MKYSEPHWAVLILFSLTFLSCSSNDQQNAFEEESYNNPNGFTRTNSNGEVIDKDDNDWRISPMHSGDIEVFQPAYPNPSVVQNIRIEFLVAGLNAINGIYLLVRNNDGSFKQLRSDSRPTLPTGLTSFNLNPRELEEDFNLYHVDGLYRLFFYDNRDNLITYGDLKISSE